MSGYQTLHSRLFHSLIRPNKSLYCVFSVLHLFYFNFLLGQTDITKIMRYTPVQLSVDNRNNSASIPTSSDIVIDLNPVANQYTAINPHPVMQLTHHHVLNPQKQSNKFGKKDCLNIHACLQTESPIFYRFATLWLQL